MKNRVVVYARKHLAGLFSSAGKAASALRGAVASALPVVAVLLLMPQPAAQAAEDVFVNAGRGPVKLQVPDGYAPGAPAPLLVMLHGYSSSAFFTEAYFQMAGVADSNGVLYAQPNGLLDPFGLRYWNATDACCQFFGSTDDSAYLANLLDVIAEDYDVDPRRVFFTGHSNGGFMSYRMACDHADRIAGVASLAGATWLDPADCAPSEPVHVLQLHGTQDDTILYGGGCISGAGCYPSARATVEQWAGFNGCAIEQAFAPPLLDLSTDPPGPDTWVSRYANNCAAGGSADLWTIVGGAHSPGLTANFATSVIDHLLARPKPSAVACADIGRLEVNCDGDLEVGVELLGSRHDGTTVDILLGEELHVLPIVAGQATLRLPARDGPITVRLAAPACQQVLSAQCR